MVKRKKGQPCAASVNSSQDGMTTSVTERVTEEQGNKNLIVDDSVENKAHKCESKGKRDGSETTKDQGEEESLPQYKHPVLRSSVRPHKRFKKDQTPPPMQPKLPEKPVKQEPKAVKKRWEAWTVQDKNFFFEALFEHGKDFEAIQKYMEVRHKKRGDPPNLIKNKDQVRHLYYRTWHKIFKYLTPNKEMKKTHQELYGLINYGELRKKVGGGLNEKIGQKLNELITTGCTLIRHKGRNLRIKMPICKALKRLNSSEGVEEDEPTKLPMKVLIELQPCSNAAWSTIQSMAQNPRLRITVPLKKEIGSLLGFLQEKWTPHRQKLLKSLRPFLQEEPHAMLRLRLPENADIKPLNELKGKYMHSNCKTPFHFVIPETGKYGKAGTLSSSPRISGKSKSQIAKNNKAMSAALSKCVTKDTLLGDAKGDKMCEICRKIKTVNNNVFKGRDKKEKVCCCALPTASKTEKMEISNHRRKNSSSIEDHVTGDVTPIDIEEMSGDNDRTSNKETNKTDIAAKLSEECKLRQGITLRNCDGLTFTEIYAMLGMPDKIRFEYDWKKEEPPKEATEGTSGVEMCGIESTEHRSAVGEKAETCELVKTLQRLIFLADSELSEITKPKQGSSSNTSPSRSSASFAASTPPSKSTIAGVKTSATNKSPKENTKISANKAAQRANINASSLIAGSDNCSDIVRSATIGDQDKEVFVVPTTLPATKKISPATSSQQDKAFMAQLQSINKEPNIFLPRYKKRTRGRKPLVVQRTLLPRPSQNPTRHMMSLSIVQNSTSAGTGSFTPILPSQLGVLASTATPSNTNRSKPRNIAPLTSGNTTTTNTINTVNTIAIAAKVAGVPGHTSPIGSPLQLTNMGSPSSLPQVMGPGLTVNGVSTDLMTMAVTSCGTQPQPADMGTMQISHIGGASTSVTTNTDPLITSGSPTKTGSVPISAALSINTTGTSSENTNHLLVSPPNISSLLDISLPPPDGAMLSTSAESLINMGIATTGIHSFAGQLNTPVSTTNAVHSSYLTTPPSPKEQLGIASPIMSPSTSPFKLSLSTPEQQWLNGERDDISFSSILASIESPEKKDRGNHSLVGAQPPSLVNEYSRDSLMAKHAADVDTTLQYMMNENSIDYISKFADLAAQISAAPETPKKPSFDLNRTGEDDSSGSKDETFVVKALDKL
ncbi:protein cramped-like [Saccoglossus kowalevskii]|uniref:Protein cramped-like n=1 Tax=Saccoglossus kowalevskii TaxID=10224 RepID=A0ABM0GQ09_SACKO|nr:PREDICTED: protein cramped-like [Saccoglossus kowalevskii]